MLKVQLWSLQKVPLYSRCNITSILPARGCPDSWGSVAELGSEILFLDSSIYMSPSNLIAFFLKWVTCDSLLTVRGKVPVNNSHKTKPLLFCILKSPRARDCRNISGFQVAEWWNMIGLSASIPPLLPLSLFLSSSCLLGSTHSSYERIKTRVSFFPSLGRSGLFWLPTMDEDLEGESWQTFSIPWGFGKAVEDEGAHICQWVIILRCKCQGSYPWLQRLAHVFRLDECICTRIESHVSEWYKHGAFDGKAMRCFWVFGPGNSNT